MAIVDGNIRCSDCKSYRPLASFPPSVQSRGRGICRACNGERSRAQSPRARLDSHLRRCYGIDAEDYQRILDAQSGGCACCGKKANKSGRRLFVDHCHVTEEVRGLLCYSCNTGIGNLGDSAAGVRRALNYLEPAQDKPLLTFAF